MMPITLGTTSRIPPATPDLAGSPTWKRPATSRQRSRTCLFVEEQLGCDEGDTDVEGELSGEVVHAARVHQTQSVSHRLRAQHALACDWTEAAVGQGRRHDAGALAGHLDGAQLTEEGLECHDHESRLPVHRVCHVTGVT